MLICRKFWFIYNNLIIILNLIENRSYALIGVSSFFCLLLFFVFLGICGIFAPLKGSKKRAKLTKRTFAGCLKCSTIFYFLLGWFICIISVALIAPGVVSRQTICKPVIELENNLVFRVTFV